VPPVGARNSAIRQVDEDEDVKQQKRTIEFYEEEEELE